MINAETAQPERTAFWRVFALILIGGNVAMVAFALWAGYHSPCSNITSTMHQIGACEAASPGYGMAMLLAGIRMAACCVCADIIMFIMVGVSRQIILNAVRKHAVT